MTVILICFAVVAMAAQDLAGSGHFESFCRTLACLSLSHKCLLFWRTQETSLGRRFTRSLTLAALNEAPTPLNGRVSQLSELQVEEFL